MEGLIKLLADNGISVVCVAYLIYFNLTTMKDLVTALNNINVRLTVIEDKLENKKSKKKSEDK